MTFLLLLNLGHGNRKLVHLILDDTVSLCSFVFEFDTISELQGAKNLALLNVPVYTSL